MVNKCQPGCTCGRHKKRIHLVGCACDQHSSKSKRFTGKKTTKENKRKFGERTKTYWAMPENNERLRKISRETALKTWSKPGPYPHMARPGNKNALGSRWKRTEESIEKIRQRTKALWEQPNAFPNAGIGKTGYRENIGHFVRSRWEANFARILKFLGVEYEYENYTFKLPDLRTYRPDFFIPSLNYHFEIKGYETELSNKKHFGLMQLEVPIVQISNDHYRRLEKKYDEHIPLWEKS